MKDLSQQDKAFSNNKVGPSAKQISFVLVQLRMNYNTVLPPMFTLNVKNNNKRKHDVSCAKRKKKMLCSTQTEYFIVWTANEEYQIRQTFLLPQKDPDANRYFIKS